MMQMTEPMAIAPTMPSEPGGATGLQRDGRDEQRSDGHAGDGLFDDPISPTMREETVAKKKPNTSTISAPRKLTGWPGTAT